MEDLHDPAHAANGREEQRWNATWGPSGAAVWSAPAVDAERNRLYITTGDSYSNPAAPESDAIMALAMDTGRVLWIRQTLAGRCVEHGVLETPAESGERTVPQGAGPTTTSAARRRW